MKKITYKQIAAMESNHFIWSTFNRILSIAEKNNVKFTYESHLQANGFYTVDCEYENDLLREVIDLYVTLSLPEFTIDI